VSVLRARHSAPRTFADEREDDADSHSEAGPSSPIYRPLKAWYDEEFEACSVAYEVLSQPSIDYSLYTLLTLQAHEINRAAEQVDEISDWLDRCQQPVLGGLDFGFDTRRLPIGIIQGEFPIFCVCLGYC
jgi:hypothetical protein